MHVPCKVLLFFQSTTLSVVSWLLLWFNPSAFSMVDPVLSDSMLLTIACFDYMSPCPLELG